MNRKLNVVIVDSNPARTQHITTLLQGLPCAVQTAPPLAAGKADVLLCNWQEWLKGLKPSGKEVLPHFPAVVMVSQSPDEGDWQAALDAGAFDLVEEPQTPEAVTEFLRVMRLALQYAGDRSNPGAHLLAA